MSFLKEIFTGIVDAECSAGRSWSTLSTNVCTVLNNKLVACNCPFTTCKQLRHGGGFTGETGDNGEDGAYGCVYTTNVKLAIGLAFAIFIGIILTLFYVAEQRREMSAYKLSGKAPKNLTGTCFNALFGKPKPTSVGTATATADGRIPVAAAAGEKQPLTEKKS